MPLGDPEGGNFEYTVEGLPETLFACTVPVTDMARAVRFYTEILGMRVLGEGPDETFLIRGACRIVLRRGDKAGVDTGIYLGVDSPYNTRRRFIDDVRFASDPARGPMGTSVSFYDSEGNVLRAIETGAEFRPRTIS